MIKAKEVMERLRNGESQQDRLYSELRDIEQKLDTACLRIMEIADRQNKLLDEIYRLEASVAMWQRKYEQTLNKEEKKNDP